MVCVTAHPAVEKQLGAEDLAELMDEFKAWKESDDEFGHVMFGKDGGFGRPRQAVEEELRHVHLFPHGAPEFIAWMEVHKRSGRKTSDRILIYTRGLYDPDAYYLIAVADPDGHEKMNQAALVAYWITAAEAFRAEN